MSQAIESETVELDGQTYRISISLDDAPPNPLEDWSEMGTILSLNRRHVNFDPAGIGEAINDPDAVPLGYFEHGRCLWSVAGELPPVACCPWDSMPFAGLWLPDDATRDSASGYGDPERRSFLRERARQASDVYSQWCNGEVSAYEIRRVTIGSGSGEEQAEIIDRCGGFYEREDCWNAARAALTA
jgi:hypothetical protein